MVPFFETYRGGEQGCIFLLAYCLFCSPHLIPLLIKTLNKLKIDIIDKDII